MFSNKGCNDDNAFLTSATGICDAEYEFIVNCQYNRIFRVSSFGVYANNY